MSLVIYSQCSVTVFFRGTPPAGLIIEVPPHSTIAFEADARDDACATARGNARNGVALDSPLDGKREPNKECNYCDSVHDTLLTPGSPEYLRETMRLNRELDEYWASNPNKARSGVASTPNAERPVNVERQC
jgi:hypothetical protein